MLTIPAGFHDGAVTSLQVCWVVTRGDGVEIRGTEWDRDLVITTGTYAGTFLARAGITGSDIRSTSDLSVDNLEVTGALAAPLTTDSSSASSLFLLDVTAADIEAGLLDNAEAVTFLVNSNDPDLYQRVLRAGWLGNSQRTAEGQYKIELRGLTQALSQGIVRTYSIGCDAELGDARCKVDMTSFTHNRFVAGIMIPRRRIFHSGASLDFTGQIVGGKVTFTSGPCDGFSMEIKEYDSPNQEIGLYLPTPVDFELTDTFTVTAGCDKAFGTCKVEYNNIVNRRAHAVFVPGQTEVLKVGTRR